MIRWFEQDSYRTEQEAVVLSCEPAETGYHLRLDESIFFPEEGGQYADTGVLLPRNREGEPTGEELRLLDGKKRGEDISYLVEGEIPAGTRVLCRLNWEQRFSRMQQHTGEHILSGTIHRTFGYSNVGFHLSDEGPVTLDVSGPMTWEQAMEMESAANEVVTANLPVTACYPSREELAGLVYRSKKEIEGQVRLIRIGSAEDPADLCACCAPHVARTGEVGIIKILTLQNYKGGVRLGILCGKRALEHYRREWQRLGGLARALSTGVEQVPEAVASLREEAASCRERVAELTEQAVIRQIETMPARDSAALFWPEELPAVVMKNCYNAMTARFSGFSGIFTGQDAQGYRFAAGSAHRDSRELAKLLREEFGARGGGSREMIQGRVNAGREALEAFWNRL